MQKESVSKQGRKPAKSEPTMHKDPAFDDLDDAMDHKEPEDAHDAGTPNKGTAEPNEGTAKPKDGNSNESAAPTTVFRDDETIAQFLVTMSQNKTKQKGFEIKEIKDTDRPRTTTKIKFAQLANDEEIARKVSEEWEAEEEKKKLAEEEATKAALIRDYDDIQARIEADSILAARLQDEEREKFTIEERAKLLHDTIALKEVKSSDENFITIGSAEDERIIRKLNKKVAGTKKADSIKEESKEEQ
ncbi:hypothetical protein Tco_0978974 [Tanacetum coccineum]|uniref:Uncharacterized protein n=1 Tax=Tanacetum coccineum TaxID=301880 RepID=A0ABQ5EPK8_9ASTR